MDAYSRGAYRMARFCHLDGAAMSEHATENDAVAVGALRDAFRDWAHVLTDQTLPVDEQLAKDRADLDRALRQRGVILDSDELGTVHTLLRQRSFMGGNYTLDAKAARKALTRPIPPAVTAPTTA